MLNAFRNESNSSSFSEVQEVNSTVVGDSKTKFSSASLSNDKEEFSSITVDKATESNFTVSNKNVEEFNSTLQPALNQLSLTVLNVKCGQNQELKECGSACPPTCNVKSPKCEEHCIKDVCQCKVSQLCFKSFILQFIQEGFVVSSNGTCILPSECVLNSRDFLILKLIKEWNSRA